MTEEGDAHTSFLLCCVFFTNGGDCATDPTGAVLLSSSHAACSFHLCQLGNCVFWRQIHLCALDEEEEEEERTRCPPLSDWGLLPREQVYS